MSLNIKKEIAVMERLTVPQLREKYEATFGEACRSNHKTWLVRRIAWRLQANAEGDLSERARQRAAELANDADLRLKAPAEKKTPVLRIATATVAQPPDKRLPPPGSVITRAYKGRDYRVTVRKKGIEFEGEIYSSLSAVAKRITGTHTNGFLFFRLNGGQK
ncbi:MAG: DUF2924 domain-containing protein [Planctomycetaceae bacterium]